MALVSPSVLSADLGNIQKEIERLNESNADMIHIDVMDGVFVPNISFGFPVMEVVHKVAKLPMDVHLMIVDPGRYVGQVRDSGADIMNIHLEASRHLHRDIQNIRSAGMKAAVTLNPATPVSLLEDIIGDLDMVLLMSVNPGFCGQSFIENTVAKTSRLKDLIARSGSNAKIEVDGGINVATGRKVVEAGADILVSGNYIFKSDNPLAAIEALKKI